MHIFTFVNTDFFIIPVTNMPIYNRYPFHLWNRVGGAQTYLNLCMNCICHENTKLQWNCRPFTKRLMIAWAAYKYTQSVATLQPYFSQINKPK